MNLAELKNKLVNKELNNLYIFAGQESGIRDKYVNSISKLAGKEKRNVKSVRDLFNILSTTSLMQKDELYIVRDDKDFLLAENKWAALEKIVRNKNVILIYSSLDKRKTFYKKHKDKITEFEKLTTTQLLKYIHKELNLKQEYSEALIVDCDNSYSRLILEMDKIKTLSEACKIKYDAAYLKLMEDGQIQQERGIVVFDFVDAVLYRKEKLSFKLLKDLKDVGTHPILLLSLIYAGFRQVLLVQGSERPTQESTGLTGYIISITKNKIKNYTITEIINALKKIQWTDFAIKNGKIDSNIAVESLLLEIL